MNFVPMTHEVTQALDMDTAWMVVACHGTPEQTPAQYPDGVQPFTNDEGSDA